MPVVSFLRGAATSSRGYHTSPHNPQFFVGTVAQLMAMSPSEHAKLTTVAIATPEAKNREGILGTPVVPGPKEVEVMMAMLRQNSQIARLMLSARAPENRDGWVRPGSDEYIDALLEGLRHPSSAIRQLDLNINNLKDSRAGMFLEGLRGVVGLKEVAAWTYSGSRLQPETTSGLLSLLAAPASTLGVVAFPHSWISLEGRQALTRHYEEHSGKLPELKVGVYVLTQNNPDALLPVTHRKPRP